MPKKQKSAFEVHHSDLVRRKCGAAEPKTPGQDLPKSDVRCRIATGHKSARRRKPPKAAVAEENRPRRGKSRSRRQRQSRGVGAGSPRQVVVKPAASAKRAKSDQVRKRVRVAAEPVGARRQFIAVMPAIFAGSASRDQARFSHKFSLKRK